MYPEIIIEVQTKLGGKGGGQKTPLPPPVSMPSFLHYIKSFEKAVANSKCLKCTALGC